jgi:hypothetical protein
VAKDKDMVAVNHRLTEVAHHVALHRVEKMAVEVRETEAKRRRLKRVEKARKEKTKVFANCFMESEVLACLTVEC